MFDGNTADFQIILICRMIAAALCGLAVGYERKFHQKSAGVKTHVIVALASALIMEVSKYGFFDVGEADTSRVAAQVVSGISFLGAGIIIKRNQNVEGLTTAAGIWMMSGIGLAIGSGLYVIGLACTILYIVLNLAVRMMDQRYGSCQVSYSMDIKNGEDIRRIMELCEKARISGYSFRKGKESGHLEMTVVFKSSEFIRMWEERLIREEGILAFERII